MPLGSLLGGGASGEQRGRQVQQQGIPEPVPHWLTRCSPASVQGCAPVPLVQACIERCLWASRLLVNRLRWLYTCDVVPAPGTGSISGAAAGGNDSASNPLVHDPDDLEDVGEDEVEDWDDEMEEEHARRREQGHWLTQDEMEELSEQEKRRRMLARLPLGWDGRPRTRLDTVEGASVRRETSLDDAVATVDRDRTYLKAGRLATWAGQELGQGASAGAGAGEDGEGSSQGGQLGAYEALLQQSLQDFKELSSGGEALAEILGGDSGQGTGGAAAGHDGSGWASPMGRLEDEGGPEGGTPFVTGGALAVRATGGALSTGASHDRATGGSKPRGGPQRQKSVHRLALLLRPDSTDPREHTEATLGRASAPGSGRGPSRTYSRRSSGTLLSDALPVDAAALEEALTGGGGGGGVGGGGPKLQFRLGE